MHGGRKLFLEQENFNLSDFHGAGSVGSEGNASKIRLMSESTKVDDLFSVVPQTQYRKYNGSNGCHEQRFLKSSHKKNCFIGDSSTFFLDEMDRVVRMKFYKMSH